MAGSTPIYGFPYPQPSDLVANYPALGQELAEDIEAVLPTLGGTARVLTQTFSAAATVNVNNCFTSTYDNYQIMLDVPTISANCNIQIRLRASGTDSSATYYLGASQVRMTDGNNGADNTNNGSLWNISQPETGVLIGGASMIMNGPAIARITRMSYQSIAVAGGVPFARSGVGYHDTATAYDGFSIIASAGNMTGTVRVYGFRNS